MITETEMERAQLEYYKNELTTMSIEQLEQEYDRVNESYLLSTAQNVLERHEACLIAIQRELSYRHRRQDMVDTHRCFFCGDKTTTDPADQYPPATYCDHSGENT